MKKNTDLWSIVGFGAIGAAIWMYYNGNNKIVTKKNDSTANRGNTSNAVWNKNPGNIRNAGFRYSWEITPSNNVYKMFPTWQEGTAAMIVHLWRYISGSMFNRKLDTIRKIIETYAPTSENDTENYIAFVRREMGLNSADSVLRFDFQTISLLVKAMSKMEDGAATKEITPQVLNNAWILARTEISKNWKVTI